MKSQMYPSNSNYNICNDLISYSEQAFLQLPNLNIISNSKQEDPSPLCFLGHISSSPSIDGNAFLQNHHDVLFHQQSMVKSDKNTTGTVTNTVDSRKTHINRQKVAEQIPRKRTYKGDRHSKINTARGPRDRRMRLSLEVARKFFGLQDMLGFDKASKTVEWLLLQAKVEIKKLAREMKRSCSVGVKTSASSTSECGEVLSGIDEVAIYDGNQQGRVVSKERASTCTAPKEKKNIRQWRKSAFHPLARESRDQARARARERTKEKLRTRRLDESKLCEVDNNSCDFSRSRLWSLLETGEESAGTHSHNMNPSMEVLPEIEEESSHAQDDGLGAAEDMVNDDSLVIIGRWSPSLIFNTVNINTGISQEHHEFTDFPFFGNNNNQHDKDYLSYVWR
ncbi:hypothetical protein I3760_16G083700 [Carya illinoinensis]|uniref:Uncharacterized protein n=1 Tax=Carya illinoinensis TaxID=32201 RepID=A0A8T1N4N3_CARIL|nr:transcription factor DICHOTOMA-like [Carya illinoinensis]KAG2664470.1 hypothetical protein I3760_16G083700 [Carya illinoinensis]KAG6625255.1 hypothetical protein CIPAW_16G083900 [Carya illinoinensis]KAG6672814.1 hypothetical protein I3842_16G077700 [Carya illinoinensis]KAG6672815.1 hypothetical protein I3842_16G077700 [Carya illinoinensis]